MSLSFIAETSTGAAALTAAATATDIIPGGSALKEFGLFGVLLGVYIAQAWAREKYNRDRNARLEDMILELKREGSGKSN